MIKKYVVMLLFVGLLTACIGGDDDVKAAGQNQPFIGKWRMVDERPQNINFYASLEDGGAYAVFDGENKITDGKWSFMSPDRIKIDVWNVGDIRQTVVMSMEGVMDNETLVLTRGTVSKIFNRIK